MASITQSFSKSFSSSTKPINVFDRLLRLVSPSCNRFKATSARDDSNGELRSRNATAAYSAADEPDVEFASEELQNVSRLPPNRLKEYHGVPPDVPFKDMLHRQQRYARFGSASGEDPRIMWPSRSTILAMEEEEKEDCPQNLSQRLAQIQIELNLAHEEKMARRRQIEYNMSQMPKWIKEYEQKQVQAQRDAEMRAVKKEALLEEARDYFGYKVKPNDPKFQQMLEEKEEKEKAEAKRKKKEEKAKKMAAKLSQEAAKVASSSSNDKKATS